MRRLFATSAASGLFFCGVVAIVGESGAKSSYDSPYSYPQTWNTALRLVRVDLGYKIVEKDEQAGYILFEYGDKGGTSSLELLKTANGVRVVCQMPKYPSYHEVVVLDRLTKKLKEEHGNPPEKAKPSPDTGLPETADAPTD